jgi:alpha-L-arabinofuranosidase
MPSIKYAAIMKSKVLSAILCLQFFVLSAQNKAVFTVQANKPVAQISPNMWGIFFEDINQGADGGLYAELVKNKSFEFANPLMGWKVTSKTIQWGINFGAEVTVINQTEKAATNPRFLRINMDHAEKGKLGINNEGFHGMGIKKDLRYDFSVVYRQQTTSAILHIELENEKGAIIGSAILKPNQKGDDWYKAELSFQATQTAEKATMNIWFEGNGQLDLDMISLFPSDTWKGRKGGLRSDMVQLLADMKPGFIRFPGGCIVEGRDLATRYQWKKTIGPVADRKLMINRWNTEFAHRPAPDYYQSFGLGFYEYFQMAEDIGAAPLPILSCGIACQFNTGELASISDLDPYIQDAIDLIEFANSPVDTKWGSVRAGLGHPAPFNLKMIGVGNENWGPQYIDRLQIFQDAIAKKYPDIKLVCSSGFMGSGDVFEYLNASLRKMKIGFVDEHYYSSPQWFLDNAKRYDNYDRKSVSKVFAGEYAAQSIGASSPDNKNNWRTAITEAAFLTGLERNADVVQMASYAPLFAHVEGWQWKPDLIWVNNLRSMATPNYYVQKLYATNKGSYTVPLLNQNQETATGQDSIYATSAIDKQSNELIIKIVNVKAKTQVTELTIEGAKKNAATAKWTVMQNNNLEAENSFESIQIEPIEQSINLKGKTIAVELKPYSFNVFRIKL